MIQNIKVSLIYTFKSPNRDYTTPKGIIFALSVQMNLHIRHYDICSGEENGHYVFEVYLVITDITT